MCCSDRLNSPRKQHVHPHRIQTAHGLSSTRPSVVVVVLDDEALRFIESPSFQKGHSVVMIEEHNAKLWTRTVGH